MGYMIDNSRMKNMRILLIEDDEWIRGSLSLFFGGHGCHLRAVETGEEGLEAVSGEDFDLIIVDYRLPGIDGLEFLRRVHRTHPDIPKLLITAYGNKEVFAEAARMGARECIEKPLTAKMVERAISKLMMNDRSIG